MTGDHEAGVIEWSGLSATYGEFTAVFEPNRTQWVVFAGADNERVLCATGRARGLDYARPKAERALRLLCGENPQGGKKQTELGEQAQLFAWIRRNRGRAGCDGLRWVHHVPNGGERDAHTAAKMRAMGVERGVPDISIPVRRRYMGADCPGAILELKAGRATVSREQEAWLDHYAGDGWAVFVPRSWPAAARIIAGYLGLPPEVVGELPVGDDLGPVRWSRQGGHE